MKEVIGVRFRENGKIYFFNPLNYKIDPGRYVIVETQHGVEFGKVVLGRREVDETKLQGESRSSGSQPRRMRRSMRRI
mgnify:CR=1 FL=1